MSGGVDSSVAAALLVRDGYEVIGCFMRLGSVGEGLEVPAGAACRTEDEGSRRPLKIAHRGCCSVSDAADARAVAAELGIPLYVCNFKKDFGRIIDYFVDEYAAGRTPNPCVRCNDWLKFGRLHEYARSLGCGFVASGHYARTDGGRRLLRGVDHGKDQSYVLFGVPRAHLEHMLLPIGGFEKTRVREMAREFGLPVFDKPDSQEICFVPDDDYAGLVERRRPELAASGTIVSESGETLGEHAGQHRFTVGQRRGLGLAVPRPLYVLSKDPRSNTVTVGERERLACTGCIAGEANWLTDADLSAWTPVLAKYRYNTPAARARVHLLNSASGATPSGRVGRFEVVFDEPQQAVAAGQAVVLHDARDPDLVLGGGWAESVFRRELQPLTR
ncbi:MAG: tRNA 2-thiouridine(34) synthase MnmA [Phycisphaerales bacterium]|nr:tRNA 2-thiouridine(34) synthase MnmA [Phycisphaerales bacterium]